jgi:iron complex transport system ATP-binding protein
MTRLEVKDCCIDLGLRRVVRDVSATVGAGEFLGLLGPNGAGKTTLIKAMAGLLSPVSGAVLLNGLNVAAQSSGERAKIVSYLPQGSESHWPLAVEQVVALGRLPHRAPWSELSQKDIAVVAECMSYTDIMPLSGRRLDELSGGERSRVLLARALAAEPKILLADEPVAGLDPAHQMDVMGLFKRLAREGAGVVAVLHDLTLAARYCDRLLLMSDGRLFADGPPGEVLTPANLARCFGIRAYSGHNDEGLFVVPLARISPEEAANP